MDFAKIFTTYGVPYVEHGDWRSRVRPGTFDPEGILIHHTASTDYDATLKVVTHGRPDLNGPLCNIYVAKGKCILISAGRANHAGAGASKTLYHLRRNEAPKGSAHDLGYPDDLNGGNGLLVGFEILSPGNGTLLPAMDWDVAVRGATAILKYLGERHAARIIGHAEWTSRKVDPQLGHGKTAHDNMNAFRAAAAPYLK